METNDDYPKTVTISKDEYNRLTCAYNDRYNNLVEKFAVALAGNSQFYNTWENENDHEHFGDWCANEAYLAATALLEAEEKRKAKV